MCVCVQEQPLGQVSLGERHEKILVGAVAVEIRHAVDNHLNLIRLEELNPLRHTCELEGTSGFGSEGCTLSDCLERSLWQKWARYSSTRRPRPCCSSLGRLHSTVSASVVPC